MKTTQLRRYELEPEKVSAFIAWFEQEMPALRRLFEFEIEFYMATDNSEFIWAVSIAGDKSKFLANEQEYLQSTARAEAFETFPDGILEKHISFVL